MYQFLRDFDLPTDLNLPLRLYVLRCEQEGFLGAFCYYVGLVPEEELHERMHKHSSQDVVACKYTSVNKPLGLELLWPATHRAAEGYLFLYVWSKFRCEKDVLRHVRLGGFVQTATKPLSVGNCNSLQRQFRMVKDLCLVCGLSGHKAGEEQCKLAMNRRSTVAPPALPSVLPESVSVPLPAVARSPHTGAEAVASTANDDSGFDAWLGKRRRLPLVPDDGGWLPLKSVLVALGESPQNPARFVTEDGDSPAKLWKLGRRGRVPKVDTDWKRASASARSPWYVRKAFPKKVVQERYPAQLRARGCTLHLMEAFEILTLLLHGDTCRRREGRAQHLRPGKGMVTSGEAYFCPGKHPGMMTRAQARVRDMCFDSVGNKKKGIEVASWWLWV